MRWTAVFWKEWTAFRSVFFSATASMIVGPLLYLLAFGWGLGQSVSLGGTDYMTFVLPGIIAMSTMTSGFTVIAADINMSRSYLKTFEAVMASPIGMGAYVIARISANVLRCLYAAILIVLVSFLFKSRLTLNGYFFLMLLLNSYVFSTIGFIAGILIESHAGISKVSSFVITPMSFLCGAFFPLEKFPVIMQKAIAFLPLTVTVNALRGGVRAVDSFIPPLVLAAYLAVLLPLAVFFCKRSE
jgi:ABC-type multidrug transport system permease subunit